MRITTAANTGTHEACRLRKRWIVSGGKGDAESKIAAMEEAGIKVAASPSELGSTLLSVLNK